MQYIRWIFAAAMVLSVTTGDGFSQAPVPPWSNLLKNELVVVGRYQSHKNGVLALEVVEVLRGKTCQPGDVLSVKLAQSIGLKFHVVENINGNLQSAESFMTANDGKLPHPRLCHIVEEKGKIHETVITYNTAQPATWFFAREKQPLLEGVGQVQPLRSRGWKQALEGKPVDLSFQMLWDAIPEAELTRKATAELFKTRDREAIAGLVEALQEPNGFVFYYRRHLFARNVLVSLGDKNGDVYDPLRRAIRPRMDTNMTAELIHLLPLLDRKRAHADFKEMLKPDSGFSRQAVCGALLNLESDEGLELIFEYMQAGDQAAYYSLEGLMFNRHGYGQGAKMVQRARLQEAALPRLKKLLKDRSLPKDIHDVAMFYANFRFAVEEPPPTYQGWQVGTGFPTSNLPRRDGFPDWQRLVWESRDDLEPILKADLIHGRKLLKDRLAVAPVPGPNGPFDLLVLGHLAHRYGDINTVKVFKKPADPIVRFMQADAAIFHRVPLSHFLKTFAKAANGSSIQWSNMAAIFPEHADLFFRQIEALLVADNKFDREFAIRQLEDRFFWNFDFAADDYPIAAQRKLEAIKPLFDRLRRTSDLLEMRGLILQHFSVKLDGPPGRAWLPAVEAAALRWNTVIHKNAMCVLGMIEEDTEVMRFTGYPLIFREKELHGHLKEFRARTVPVNLTAADVKAHWKDLDNAKQTVSYEAMKSLLKGGKATVDFLGKQLKQPARDAVRDVRGIQVLEYMPGREARALLDELARGPQESPVAHEARGAVQRLTRFWRW